MHAHWEQTQGRMRRGLQEVRFDWMGFVENDSAVAVLSSAPVLKLLVKPSILVLSYSISVFFVVKGLRLGVDPRAQSVARVV